MSDTRLNFVTSVEAMQSLEPEPYSFLVEGLFRTGRRRINLIAGKPGVGKSTAGRQLLVDLSKGRPHLGRNTVRCESLLWGCEEDLHDLRDSFRNSGYDPRVDAPIHVLENSSDVGDLKKLNDALHALPKVQLLLLETLDDVLRMTDLKENSAAREAFQRFDDLVFEKHYKRVCCVALHHLRKRDDSYDSGDRLLGASVIRGKTDAKIFIDKISDDDERRIIHATVRRGRPIPKTLLAYDPQTEISTLGPPYASLKAGEAERTASRIENEIFRFVADNPGASLESSVRSPLITGNTTAKREAFNRLIKDTRIVKQGRGVKGQPAGYVIAEIPAAVGEQFGEAVLQ